MTAPAERRAGRRTRTDDADAPGSTRPEPRFLTSRELGLVLLLALGAGFALLALLQSLPASVHWGLMDLRTWQVESTPLPVRGEDAEGRGYFERLQDVPPPQRPFDLALMLPRAPQVGDRTVARTTVAVEPGALYCFRVYLESPYVNEAPNSRDFFVARVRVGETEAPPVEPAATKDPIEVVVRGVEAVDDTLELAVILEAQRARPRDSWRRASLVRVQFADLWRCSEGAS